MRDAVSKPDRQLPARADSAAWVDLHSRYAAEVLRIVRRVLRNPADAADVVQDVFLQVWRDRDKFDASRGSIGGWLRVLSRSRAIDRLRADRRRDAHLCHNADPDRRPSAGLHLGDHAAARHAIRPLPFAQRLACELAFVEGYTHMEVAAMLGQPLGTIKSRIHAAVERLRAGTTCERDTAAGTALAGDEPFTMQLVEYLTRHRPLCRNCAALTGTRVLVLDDDEDTREMVMTVLEAAGATVHCTSSVRDALAEMPAANPAVVIVDIVMPARDGYDFLRSARALPTPRVSFRAMAFTALNRDCDRDAARDAGFDLHVAKPVPPFEIVRNVASLAHRAASDAAPAPQV